MNTAIDQGVWILKLGQDPLGIFFFLVWWDLQTGCSWDIAWSLVGRYFEFLYMWNLFLYLVFIPAARGICKCFQLTDCGVLANSCMCSAKPWKPNQLPFPAVSATWAMLTTPFAKFCPELGDPADSIGPLLVEHCWEPKAASHITLIGG